MKFVISFFLCSSVSASPIHLFFESEMKDVESYRELLVKDYQIPEELISLKMTKDCEDVKGEGKLDLCLKNNGDLLVVSVDRNFINESLKVFRAP